VVGVHGAHQPQLIGLQDDENDHRDRCELDHGFEKLGLPTHSEDAFRAVFRRYA
jgi:hypothetical protein